MVSASLSSAHDVEDVVLGQLRGPEQLAGIEIKGENGVTGLGGGLGEVVAGSGVDDSLFGVDGWRRPDAGARRPPILHACRCFGRGLRFFHRVGFPNLFSSGGIESYQRATRRATLVFVAKSDFFPAGYRNKHPSIEILERAYDLGLGMRVNV